MEKKLRKMFDYQRFEQNPRLNAMIEAAEGRGCELSDDDLSAVNAAVKLTNTEETKNRL